MIPRILAAEPCGPRSLRLTFSDETEKVVDITPPLDGPIFEPLRDPGYFARAALDEVSGTVVWPNGADFAPEALRDLPDAGGADPPPGPSGETLGQDRDDCEFEGVMEEILADRAGVLRRQAN